MTQYLYRSGDPELAPVLLLHSTGGDETELLQLAELLLPNHPVLAIRGRVNENGYNRYFERYAEGQFNLASLATETDWLYDELIKLAAKFELDVTRMIVIGYSNGANMALHMSLVKAVNFSTILAHHAMQLSEIAPIKADQLSQTDIFLTYCHNDPIVSDDNFKHLVENLRAAGANPMLYTENTGHQLSNNEIFGAQNFLQKLEKSHNHPSNGWLVPRV
ncbi:MAG: dienelactone hydrolase family protein [Streptococcaceae bacterium]|jgi:phospholipase/carboxylesterase|nr:dienelactone hydrolase family protein [Streptococcaceae bacterium]